jgi:Asp-tRNA(Asn)/Glu-tRNA(Gln) amidotransferase A subunit family amidase
MVPERGLHLLSAAEAARWIREARIGSVELVQACLAQIESAEGVVGAFTFLDPQHALDSARAADARRASGEPLGALHGVPIAIKDIFDTAAMPTELGTVLHRGRTPSYDATVVTRLEAAGAIVLGKSVTTEFAVFGPGKTTNPHNSEHTPGGSSSGSAAAVAANMVPFALGSQTNGSTIRPAAYCGVLGFKPTFGLISRRGMLRLSRSLDHVGLFARSIDDIALLLAELAGHDPDDPDTRPLARHPFTELAAAAPPIEPQFALIKTPHYERAESAVHAVFADLRAELGARLEEVDLLPSALGAWQQHQTIMEAEMAHSLSRDWERGKEQLSGTLREQLERGRRITALEYQTAVAAVGPMYESFAELFEQRYDAIITPATLGPAPRGLASTGDPVFCTPWSLCGMPALNLPLFEDDAGMPIGIQLVGARGADARLLRTARWLAARLSGTGGVSGSDGAR